MQARETGPSDYYLAETGHFLFVLCMLRHIEADDKAFERIANDNRFRSAGQHVQRTDQR